MRPILIGASGAILAVIAVITVYAQVGIAPMALTADDIEWDTERSNHRANIAGSNETSGLYIYRTRFPQGFRNQPHFHPDNRVVTVMSGTLHVGYGAEFDEAALKPIPAGGMWTEPSGQPHFVWAKEGPVIIQVVGEGPSGTTLTNP
jgi:quercetin dioxygenase-like cupin family protein